VTKIKMIDKAIFDRIAMCPKSDPHDLTLALIEEWARALRSEPSKDEIVDLMLNATEIFIAAGGSHAEAMAIADSKLSKYESTASQSEF
jgi:hypothetical protein